MKKNQLIIAALAAIAGIGGAYSSVKSYNNYTGRGPVYNWYTPAGSFTFSGTIGAVTVLCPGGPCTCLRGTSPGQPSITIYHEC